MKTYRYYTQRVIEVTGEDEDDCNKQVEAELHRGSEVILSSEEVTDESVQSN